MRRSTWLRVLSLLLIPALMFTSAPSAKAASPVFADVPQGTQFQTEIEWLASQGISEGWTESGRRLYKPLQPIARDAMAAFLYRFAGRAPFTPPATSPFADLRPNDQFYKEITWLYSTGITTGWVEGGKRYYRPLDPIARDAMAAFLYRYAKRATGMPEHTPDEWGNFDDVPEGTDFYKEIQWVSRQGISTGWSGTDDSWTFRPLESVKRDAMAAFLYRSNLVITMYGDSPQRGTMPSGFSFVGATRQSVDFGPVSLCSAQRIPYYPSLNARTAGRMVENGGQIGMELGEGEEHYYAEAALTFPTVTAAQAYMGDIEVASKSCVTSGWPGYQAVTVQPTGAWDQAIATFSGGTNVWNPWGTEVLVARRGHDVVHYHWSGEPLEVPTAVSPEARETVTTLLNRLSA